jgi:hypothetical protein
MTHWDVAKSVLIGIGLGFLAYAAWIVSYIL